MGPQCGVDAILGAFSGTFPFQPLILIGWRGNVAGRLREHRLTVFPELQDLIPHALPGLIGCYSERLVIEVAFRTPKSAHELRRFGAELFPEHLYAARRQQGRSGCVRSTWYPALRGRLYPPRA